MQFEDEEIEAWEIAQGQTVIWVKIPAQAFWVPESILLTINLVSPFYNICKYFSYIEMEWWAQKTKKKAFLNPMFFWGPIVQPTFVTKSFKSVVCITCPLLPFSNVVQ